MLDLPKSTHVGKIIAKEKICAHCGADLQRKGLLKEQVERVRWLHKISSTTANIAQGKRVEEIQIIEVMLKTPVPDKRILLAILAAIRYKIVFVLVLGGKVTYTVYHDSKTCFASEAPPKLLGDDTDSVWESFVVQMKGGGLIGGNTLDEQIAAEKEREKLARKIERLDKQTRRERQPRRKWDLNEEVKRLKKEWEGTYGKTEHADP